MDYSPARDQVSPNPSGDPSSQTHQIFQLLYELDQDLAQYAQARGLDLGKLGVKGRPDQSSLHSKND